MEDLPYNKHLMKENRLIPPVWSRATSARCHPQTRDVTNSTAQECVSQPSLTEITAPAGSQEVINGTRVHDV